MGGVGAAAASALAGHAVGNAGVVRLEARAGNDVEMREVEAVIGGVAAAVLGDTGLAAETAVVGPAAVIGGDAVDLATVTVVAEAQIGENASGLMHGVTRRCQSSRAIATP